MQLDSMFNSITRSIVQDVEEQLVTSMKTAPLSEWKGEQIVQALNICMKEILEQMSQIGEISERQHWLDVYSGIESMLKVMEWLNTGVPQANKDLRL